MKKVKEKKKFKKQVEKEPILTMEGELVSANNFFF